MPLDTTNWPQTTEVVQDEVIEEATALLIRARALVARGWCRGVPARNFIGISVGPRSGHATAWCMSGALNAAALVESDLDRRNAKCRLIAAIGGVSLAAFNDTQETVEPVLAAFDHAIAGAA
jgi:hypothetical protein